MARKKSSRRNRAAPQQIAQPAVMPLDPVLMGPINPMLAERSLRKISRFMQSSEFASLEEADERLQEMLAAGEIQAIVGAPPETPLEEAQDLVTEVWVDPSPAKCRRVAKKALSICADCADAYTLLGDRSTKAKEAKSFYEQGVQAAERALDPELFAEYEGNLWGVVEGRPYMRARNGLAQALWVIGEREQAIGHAWELLRLNVTDNQGVRYVLINWLLVTGADDQAQRLLDQYKEDISASWAYSRALLAFRKKPNSRAAGKARQKALDANPFVLGILVGITLPPLGMPEYIEFGEESEAVEYLATSHEVWNENLEAVDWLAEPLAEFLNSGADLSIP